MNKYYWIISTVITLAGMGIMAAGVHAAAKESRKETADKTAFFESAESLYVDAKRSNVQIVSDAKAEGISVTIRNPAKTAAITEDRGTLRISDRSTDYPVFFSFELGDWFTPDRSVVIVTVPAETAFNDVTLELGAGTSRMEELSMQTCRIDQGSGQLTCSDCAVEQDLTLYSGSGKLFLTDCTIGGNVDLDQGSGSISMTACEMDALRLESGSGAITVQGIAIKNDLNVSIASGSMRGDQMTAGGTSDISLASGSIDISGFTPGDQTVLDLASGVIHLGLTGKDSDYSFHCENSSGSTTIGDQSGKDLIVTGGSKQIKSYGASGTIKFQFEE